MGPPPAPPLQKPITSAALTAAHIRPLPTQVTGSNCSSLWTSVFRWCKELRRTPQTYMSSQQIYTQDRMQILNALITGTRLPMKSVKQSSGIDLLVF